VTLEGGQRLGPYDILEPLGAGGMEEVYRVRDPRLNWDVAVNAAHEKGITHRDLKAGNHHPEVWGNPSRGRSS
jgi:serine/threonine protein kinase